MASVRFLTDYTGTVVFLSYQDRFSAKGHTLEVLELSKSGWIASGKAGKFKNHVIVNM